MLNFLRLLLAVFLIALLPVDGTVDAIEEAADSYACQLGDHVDAASGGPGEEALAARAAPRTCAASFALPSHQLPCAPLPVRRHERPPLVT